MTDARCTQDGRTHITRPAPAAIDLVGEAAAHDRVRFGGLTPPDIVAWSSRAMTAIDSNRIQALETRHQDADTIGTSNFFRDGSKAGGFKAWQRDAIGMDARSNFTAGSAYDDLREWLALAERLGEVHTVRGASWQEDIGLAAAAILLDGSPQT
jgi:hypothetical protein